MHCVSVQRQCSCSCVDAAVYCSDSPLSSLQYLGLVEVEESRGMHVCEEAVKKLKVVSISLALSAAGTVHCREVLYQH